jgi:AcrR family transcriptional regulator
LAAGSTLKTKNRELEQQRRGEILEAAVSLLAQGSHRDVTLDRIARELGVSKGLVTYYFKSKDELITAAIERHLERQELALRALASDSQAPVLERLERLLLVAVPERERAERELGFLVEVWSYAKARPHAMEVVRRAYLRFRAHCEEMLASELSAGDAAWVNLVLNALVDGMSMQLAVDPALPADEIRARLVSLVRGLLHSATPGPASVAAPTRS